MSLDLSKLTGLTTSEAAQRLQTDGFNELPSQRQRGLLTLAWNVAREPMFLLLLACGGVYLLLGEPGEAAMLLGFVFVVMGITLYQERKTERAMEALRDLSSPRALVLRDGQQRRIPGREVVRDDVIIVAEGDRVPADAVLSWCSNCSADESLLTGESVPVRKTVWDGVQQQERPGGDDLPFIFSGSLVVQGQGVAKVLRTGSRTEMGKIGVALQSIEAEDTLLQREVDSLVRKLAIFGIGLCALVIVIYGVTRHDWLNGLLAGITLAMAMLPEEFPVVLTIFLALGAWRLSKQQVLTRRVAAIETLGAATVLCVDKTGTLTMNRMAIRHLVTATRTLDLEQLTAGPLPEDLHELVEFGILASQRNPFDPMERAFLQLGQDFLSNTEHLHGDWELVREYPLSPELLALSHVWKSPGGSEYVVASKGAPEAIADLCHMESDQQAQMASQVNALADTGLRVLGVARGVFRHSDLPGDQHDFVFEFLGLVGLAEPLRPTVAPAVQECYSAGMRVLMITGDHAATAQSIARQIGLTPVDQIMTGPELEAMDETTLRERLRTVSIFARMVPEQKLRLVQALKANGEIVAMTGDGVNDAPALKAAHIGIAMGGRGTDVAREASSIVLLDDDFSSIVRAVRMGRRIYDHLRKAMTYIVASHVPIAGMTLLPVIFRWPSVLLPVHILFLELLIDPACSVAFEAEPEEPDIMQRPPRPPNEKLFDGWLFGLGLVQGTSVLVIVLTVFLVALYRNLGEDDARTLAFTTLILANLGLILVNRSWSRTVLDTLRTPNNALWGVVLGCVIFLTCVLYVPFARRLFHFSTLHINDLLICLGSGILSILWFELVKRFRKH
ncbi:MAG: cation-translocating P-type ATPase [Planctomycetota bacterium]